MVKTAENVKRSRSTKPLLPDIITLIRLAIAVILLIVAYKINVTPIVSILILVAALMVSCSEIAISAVNAVKKKDYFNYSCLILLSAVACFAAGCYIESIIFAIVYELCGILHGQAVKMTKRSAHEHLPRGNEEEKNLLRAKLNHSENLENSYKQKIEPYAEFAAKAIVVIAVLYAALLPVVSDMTYVMSIRRGAMLIVAIVPVSMFASLPLCSAYGLCFSAAYGVFVKKDAALEKAARTKSVVFDKADVLTDGGPKIAAIISPVLDNESFLKSAAYTAFKSEQRIAAPIISAYNGIVNPEYIQEFSDILGGGMEVKIGGQAMLLGTQALLESRGIVLDEKNLRSGYVLYLIIAGNYAGCIVFKENINPYAAKTVSDLKAMGITSCLVSEDGREVSERTASQLGAAKFYAGCETVSKLYAVKEIKENSAENDAVIYVSAECIDYHSDADIDAKVGYSTEIEDIQMSNIGIYGLPVAISTAKKVRRISAENLLLSAAVKLILITLALTGYATLWFIVLLDFAAGIFGVLNISSIASEEAAANK